MILLTFEAESGLHLAVKTGDFLVDLTEVDQLEIPRTPQQLFSEGLGAVGKIEEYLDSITPSEMRLLKEDSLRFGPPVPSPGKIICVGRNYRKHAEEMNAKVSVEPLLFSKFTNAIAASGQAIDISGLEQVDYEAELAVVIGKRGKQIPEAEALGYVFGYCNANDLSERALQYRTSQFLIGKSLDGFLPIGPYLVTADEVGDPQNLGIRGWLNGELRQESHTSRMLFPVAVVISYVSRYMTLEPGDLLLTGTPEGVIKGRKDDSWLKAGDEYVVEVGPLGQLRNQMVARQTDAALRGGAEAARASSG